MYFGKSGCIRAIWLYLDKIGFNLEKCLLFGKVVVFGQRGCVRKR